MRMRILSASLVLFLTATAQGQTLTLPAEVKGEPGAFLSVPAVTDGKAVRWVSLDAGLNLFPVELLKDSKTAVVSGPKGRYRLLAYTAKGDVPSAPSITIVIIGEAPPVPPGPGPTPDPTPTPDPAPIPVAGFRVMIIEETADRSKLTKNQLNIITSTIIRSYLNAACVKGSDGKQPEWRIFDKDPSLAGQAKHWQDAAAVAIAKKQLPYLVISNGVTGFSGPLPDITIEEALNLFKKYEVKK